MKTIIKIISLCGVIILTAFSCKKEDIPEWSGIVEGYIIGSFICGETDHETGQATGNRTERGYCILLEGSESTYSHWPMDIYTFNLPDALFTFSAEIISSGHNGSDCGPAFFPDSLKTKYKIKFQYRKLNEKEKIQFVCGPCTYMMPTFRWEDYEQVTLDNEVSKLK